MILLIRVKIPSPAGLDTIAVATNSPVIVDRTPPVAGELRDGVEGEGDLAYQSDITTLCVNGRGFVDPESGLGGFLWGIGELAVNPLYPYFQAQLN